MVGSPSRKIRGNHRFWRILAGRAPKLTLPSATASLDCVSRLPETPAACRTHGTGRRYDQLNTRLCRGATLKRPERRGHSVPSTRPKAAKVDFPRSQDFQKSKSTFKVVFESGEKSKNDLESTFKTFESRNQKSKSAPPRSQDFQKSKSTSRAQKSTLTSGCHAGLKVDFCASSSPPRSPSLEGRSHSAGASSGGPQHAGCSSVAGSDCTAVIIGPKLQSTWP